MKVLLSSLLLLFLSISSFFAQEAPIVSGELIVQLNKTITARDLTIQLNEYNGVKSGVALDRVLSKSASIYLFKYDVDRVPQEKVLDFIYSNTGVSIAQFNHEVQNRALPNDPSIGSQWHHVDGSDNDIDSDLAWDITTGGQTSNGDEIVVCVIEGGGANYNHPDLIANHWTNTAEIDNNGIDDDGNGYIDDFNGWNPVSDNDNVGNANHGTAVSGMIGAKGNNNNGGAGVNWDVKIMQVDLGSLTEANVIESYSYPLTMRERYNASNGAEGAFVVATNASWGIDNANPANYPVWCAFYDTLGAAGILNCGATSNSNVNVDVNGDMPTGCSSTYMLGITATNSSDQRTFSGYGVNAIDLAAPGESVFLPSGTSGYSSTSGTSFASPCVAGAIALLYSAPCSDLANQALSSPQSTADLVRNYIFNGVDIIPSLVGETATGGRLNIKNSLDLLVNGCGPVEPCSPISLTLDTECVYSNSNVTATVTLSPTFNENYCMLGDVVYAELNGINTTVDASNDDVGNGGSYTISGLASNTTYNFSYQTESGSSAIETITTDNCSSLTPGCIDNTANNFNPAANINDGSCTYDCEEITFTLLTDCYAEEVAWSLAGENGEIISEVAEEYLSNNTEYTFSVCLTQECYSLTVTDSYGDGLAGSLFGCPADGSFSLTNNTDETIIDQLINPDYGSEYSIDFCISISQTIILGCTDDQACNFDSIATDNDGSCTYPGCTDDQACNYNQAAGCEDGSCIIPPANDLCADAFPLTEGINTISNENACTDEGYSVPTTTCNSTDGWCNENLIENDVFYSFTTPAFPVAISIETSFSAPISLNDTQMALFSECGGTLIAANDDGGADLYMSRLDFACGQLAVNTSFLVLIDGYDGASGIANLTLTFNGADCGDSGCTDPEAENYNSNATSDDGSCIYLCDNDTEAPVFITNATDITFDCGMPTPEIPIIEVTDNCTPLVSVVYSEETIPGSGNGFTIVRTWLAEDDSENQAVFVQTLESLDNCAPNACSADFNSSGLVEVVDLVILLGNFGCAENCIANLDDIEGVNVSDVSIFLQFFGSTCE